MIKEELDREILVQSQMCERREWAEMWVGDRRCYESLCRMLAQAEESRGR